jgi:hypothetical protein
VVLTTEHPHFTSAACHKALAEKTPVHFAKNTGFETVLLRIKTVMDFCVFFAMLI